MAAGSWSVGREPPYHTRLDTRMWDEDATRKLGGDPDKLHVLRGTPFVITPYRYRKISHSSPKHTRGARDDTTRSSGWSPNTYRQTIRRRVLRGGPRTSHLLGGRLVRCAPGARQCFS